MKSSFYAFLMILLFPVILYSAAAESKNPFDMGIVIDQLRDNSGFKEKVLLFEGNNESLRAKLEKHLVSPEKCRELLGRRMNGQPNVSKELSNVVTLYLDSEDLSPFVNDECLKKYAYLIIAAVLLDRMNDQNSNHIMLAKDAVTFLVDTHTVAIKPAKKAKQKDKGKM